MRGALSPQQRQHVAELSEAQRPGAVAQLAQQRRLTRHQQQLLAQVRGGWAERLDASAWAWGLVGADIRC